MGLVGKQIGVDDPLGNDVYTVNPRKRLLRFTRKEHALKGALLPEVGGNDRVEMSDCPLYTSDGLPVLDLPDLETLDLQVKLLCPNPKGKDPAPKLVSPTPDFRNAALVV